MAKDLFHDAVRVALEKEGWLITHDPYPLVNRELGLDYKIDLGAEQLLGAERDTIRIAVEIKSFARPSLAHEFHSLSGQYLTYLQALKLIEPDRILFLAMPDFTYELLQDKQPFLAQLVEIYDIRLVIYEPQTQQIKLWKA